jgi:hypothetical protein
MLGMLAGMLGGGGMGGLLGGLGGGGAGGLFKGLGGDMGNIGSGAGLFGKKGGFMSQFGTGGGKLNQMFGQQGAGQGQGQGQGGGAGMPESQYPGISSGYQGQLQDISPGGQEYLSRAMQNQPGLLGAAYTQPRNPFSVGNNYTMPNRGSQGGGY